MRKLLVVFSLLVAVGLSAQSDSIYLHNGKLVSGTVSTVSDFTVSFNYDGETAVQTIGKYAVAKIVYGKSHRVEQISDKISVSSKDDWQNVVILEDKSEIGGLTKVGDVKGKTAGMFSYNTAGSADKKASQRIKEAAAEMGAQFVLMISDKSDGFGVKQSIKNGVAYKY